MASLDSALLDIGELDLFARRQTPVHRIDPRAKVLVTLAYLVTVISFGKYEVSRLLPLLLYPVAIIVIGQLPVPYLAGKLLLASPFALLVGIFNPLFDRAAMMQIGALEVSGGWISFASILLRFALTLAAALILVATTGFHSVCMALTRLGVPRVFVTQLMLLYRYIFVLADEAARMMQAWSLRSVSGRAMSPKVFSALIGQLLLRALDRAHRLHAAMLSRGFDGSFRTVSTLNFTHRDAIYIMLWTAFFVFVRCYNLPRILGEAAMGWGS